MTRFATREVAVAAPAGLAPFSALVVEPGGLRVVAALASRGGAGSWAVVDAATGRTEVGRGLERVSAGLLSPGGTGLLLTTRGLARVALDPVPAVLEVLSADLGRGPDDHEQVLAPLAPDVVAVGRYGRTTTKVVAGDRVVSRVTATPPLLALPAAEPGAVRLWALGSGRVVLLDRRTWRPLGSSPAPRALAACRTPGGVVAVLSGGGRSGRLPWARRDLQLALLDDALAPRLARSPAWLGRALGDRGEAPSLVLDARGRAVLATARGLVLLDPGSLARVGRHRTRDVGVPVCWPGGCAAVHSSGDRALALVTWD